MTLRPEATYRASRRNLAKAHKLDWRALERSRDNRVVHVMLPQWAWVMPAKKDRQPQWLRRFNQTGRYRMQQHIGVPGSISSPAIERALEASMMQTNEDI